MCHRTCDIHFPLSIHMKLKINLSIILTCAFPELYQYQCTVTQKAFQYLKQYYSNLLYNVCTWINRVWFTTFFKISIDMWNHMTWARGSDDSMLNIWKSHFWFIFQYILTSTTCIQILNHVVFNSLRYNALTGEFMKNVLDPRYFGGVCEYIYNGEWRKLTYDPFCEHLSYDDAEKYYRKPHNFLTYQIMVSADTNLFLTSMQWL